MPQKTRIVSELMQQKTALEAKLNELLGASSGIEDLQIQSFADPLDQIKSNLDREITINQLDVRAHLVQDLQAALDAIHDGTYGLCASCEEPIPPKRMKAVPWARRCVRCQAEAELFCQDRSSVIDTAA